ncbi:MAG: AtpZ/AtpI family protein [Acidobacteria bacterium]|nr:AtpZ/AtpI family protein [Acidobacteriota bacterium]
MPQKSEQSKLALAFAVGGIIAYNISGGVILGYFLDRWLHTSPWLSVTGLILGTVGAFAGLYRIMSKLGQSDN